MNLPEFNRDFVGMLGGFNLGLASQTTRLAPSRCELRREGID